MNHTLTFFRLVADAVTRFFEPMVWLTSRWRKPIRRHNASFELALLRTRVASSAVFGSQPHAPDLAALLQNLHLEQLAHRTPLAPHINWSSDPEGFAFLRTYAHAAFQRNLGLERVSTLHRNLRIQELLVSEYGPQLEIVIIGHSAFKLHRKALRSRLRERNKNWQLLPILLSSTRLGKLPSLPHFIVLDDDSDIQKETVVEAMERFIQMFLAQHWWRPQGIPHSTSTSPGREH